MNTPVRNIMIVLLLGIFVSVVSAQSGNGEVGTVSDSPLRPPSLGEAIPSYPDYEGNSYPGGHYPGNYEGYRYYNYDDYFTRINDSSEEDSFSNANEEGTPLPTDLANPVMFPQEPSVCMQPVYADNESVDYVVKASTQAPRKILSYLELKSSEARKAVMLAVEYYIQEKKGSVNLEMTEIKSGCQQVLAGTLFFFVFDAKETIFCDTAAVNATCTENTMHSRECRARVHHSQANSWYPFFTECHSPEFYQIPRKIVRVRYV
ncbi:uncharacterized protein LOC120347684 [Styela clava]